MEPATFRLVASTNCATASAHFSYDRRQQVCFPRSLCGCRQSATQHWLKMILLSHLGRTLKNSARVQIWIVHSQPITNSQLHFLFVVEEGDVPKVALAVRKHDVSRSVIIQHENTTRQKAVRAQRLLQSADCELFDHWATDLEIGISPSIIMRKWKWLSVHGCES
jgi:hypothetical protein